MNALIDKDISQSQLSNFHRINVDDKDSNDDHTKTNNSFFYRLTGWLHLTKRWKDESMPEVCKHMYKASLS